MFSRLSYVHATLSILDAKYWMHLCVIDDVCMSNGGKLKFVLD